MSRNYIVNYVCDQCGALFNAPASVFRREDMNGEGAIAIWEDQFCPVCGSDDFEEIEDGSDED